MAHTCRLYGSELSSFSLKLRVMCDYAALPYTWVPADGTRLQAIASTALVEAARLGREYSKVTGGLPDAPRAV